MLELIDKKDCSGCTACASICPKQCISMRKDEEGFNYPIIDESQCIHCDLCEKICPIINKLEVSKSTQSYAAMNSDDVVRKESTSGGVFSLLANYVLDRNGYVAGAAYDSDFTVRHIIINNKTDLYKLRGAKYSQSELGDIFIQIKSILENNQWVLFSGTPCQVGGLKSFLRKDFDKLVTIDLICHGVPSPMVWSKYLEYRLHEDKGVKINNVNLRSKISGWSKYNYSVIFDYDNHQHQTINSNDIFMKSFVGNYCLRPSCSNCSFKGIHRVSDFTLGDYWGIWDQLPEMDDDKGTSIVFVHSSLGKEIFDSISNQIKYVEVNPEESIKMNGSMIYSSPKHLNREKFIQEIKEQGFTENVKTYFEVKHQKVSLFNRVINKLKNTIKKFICLINKN